MDVEDEHMSSQYSRREELNLSRYSAFNRRRFQACYCISEDAAGDLNQCEHGWTEDFRKLFHDADSIMDYLMEPATKSDGFRQLFTKNKNPPNSLHQFTDMGRLNLFYYYVHGLDGPPRALYNNKDEKEKEKEKVIELVGIDGPRDVIIKRLAGDDEMKLLSIVGAGGLGKTALAHTVYHQLKPQFDCGAFVRVPLEPGMEGFFTDMLRQLDVGNHVNINKEAKHERQLISEIREFLHNKRYLVVIDDLWNEDDWHSISCSLTSNDNGSRVITTTRVKDIATLCCSGYDETIYEIQHLGFPDSKELFLQQFSGREICCPNAPTEIFNEILKMCDGTPSAIISIALSLATKVTAAKPCHEMMNSVYSAWKQMRSSLYSGSKDIPGFEDLRRIISLRYIHLPSNLKDCLLYLVVHAKCQMIHKTIIIRKWIAEGFISVYGGCSHEEVAHRFFDELVNRNFIQLLEYDNYLGEEIYEVNYMVSYVLRLISHEDDFPTFLSDIGISSFASELSVHRGKMDRYLIRSINIVDPERSYLNNDLMYLRVLDLDGFNDLDDSAMHRICQMFLLKYLSLKHTQVTEIPQEIRKLQNLETLDVRQTNVKELPKEVVQLPRLAHLYFGQCSSLCAVKLPAGSEQLKSVKVFGTVDPREWSESAMEEISRLPGVRELELLLHDQPDDKHQNHKLLSSLSKCMNLEYLIIYGDYNPSENVLPVSPSFPLLERLKVAGKIVRVPRWIAQLNNLKKLDVRVCKLDHDDLKILGGLRGLSTLALALICIPRKKEVAIRNGLLSSTSTGLHPGEGTSPAGFMSLEIFNFECRVPWITFGERAMPRLKQLHLKLYSCSADKYPSGIINLHSLEKIVIRCSSQDASSGSVMNAVAAMREEASSHGNRVQLSVNGEDEVFLSNNRVDETITGTEIEE